ncbi:MAG: hypothetical protein EZS28_021987 [Streblomastix strix]|uniref:GBD/FH3 domain-containing protein n=1 Tax=Streblomastix strix TaxID=222440 RepID=A0A5J4VJ74_9EUKA|nr:MAG: hypothetical protein EZS28_021987 [Streblomastix strix]
MTFWKKHSSKVDEKKVESPINASENKIDDPWEKMSDEQVDEAYTKVLSELLFNEEKIVKMTSTQNRKNKITMIKQQMTKPHGQMASVLISSIRSNSNKEHVRNLRATLSTVDEKWFQDFFNSNGLQVIMDLITEKQNKPMFTIDDMEILGECILCYKALMNNYLGLQNVVSYTGTIRCLIQTLQISPRLKKVNIEKGEGRKMWGQYYENSTVVLELIAALCLVPQQVADGLKYVMEAAESFRQQNNERVVFEMVLIQLRNQSTPELFLCRILQLINTICILQEFPYHQQQTYSIKII